MWLAIGDRGPVDGPGSSAAAPAPEAPASEPEAPPDPVTADSDIILIRHDSLTEIATLSGDLSARQSDLQDALAQVPAQGPA